MNGPGAVNNRTQVQVPLDQNETIYVDTIKPNVYNVAVATLKTPTSLDVEKFLGGVPNQTLTVRVQGAVTLKYNMGGIGSIMTNTGADKLLFADRVYKFTNVDNKWYEQDDSVAGGGGGSTSFPLTINASNSGAASPALFNGSVGVTISANTVGAVALSDFVSLGDAEWVQLDGTYNDPSWLNSLAYSKLTGAPSLTGYVVGPGSATDNAIARYDSTTGKLIQNSIVTVSDTGDIVNVASLSSSLLSGNLAITAGGLLGGNLTIIAGASIDVDAGGEITMTSGRFDDITMTADNADFNILANDVLIDINGTITLDAPLGVTILTTLGGLNVTSLLSGVTIDSPVFNLVNVNGLQVAGAKVIGERKTGWAVPTGTKTRTSFDPSTVTLSQLGERVAALINDLHSGGSSSTHGLLTT